MKRKSTWILILIAAAAATVASAHTTALSSDGSGAHGGGAFVCQDALSSTLFSAESQDLWEAVKVQGLSLDPQPLDEISRSWAAVQRMQNVQPEFYAKVADALAKVIAKRNFKDVAIEEIGDNKRKFSKDSCDQGIPKFVYAAVYSETQATPDLDKQDDDLVYANKVWDLLSNEGKAALNVHEAVYKVLRVQYGDTDSRRARLIVGYLFSKASDEILATILPALRFNPRSNESYDEKRQELFDRFNKAALPKPQPGRHNEMRLCSLFSLQKQDIPRTLPLNWVNFDFKSDGTLEKMSGLYSWGMPDESDVKYSDSRASAIWIHGNVWMAFRVDVKEEANGDLLLGYFRGTTSCSGWDTYPCIFGKRVLKFGDSPDEIAYCPTPDRPEAPVTPAPQPTPVPENAKLKPLQGSQWAKDHPGVLPYESCSITDEAGRPHFGSRLMVISSPVDTGSMTSADGDLSEGTYLLCKAPRLGLMYRIPLELRHTRRTGADFQLGGVEVLSTKFSVTKLDGKALGEFFGKYKGVELQAGLVGGVGMRFLRNHGIHLKGAGLGMDIGGSLGSIRMEYQPLDQLAYGSCLNPYILTDAKTESVRDYSGCRKLEDQWGREIRNFRLDTEAMAKLRFVRVK